MSDYRAEKDGNAMVTLRGVTKTFERGGEKLQILSGLDLDIAEGSFEALMGPSGSGKSTLLNIVAGLDRPSAGSVVVKGEDITRLSETKLASWRSRTLGFIFQSYNLIPQLTVLENIEVPLYYRGHITAEDRQRCRELADLVGLGKRLGPYALETVRTPTLVVSARDDGFGTYAAAQYTASRIPGAKFVGFDHGGHLLVGHDAAVRAEVVKLLSESR